MEIFKIIFGTVLASILIFAGRKIFLENEEDSDNIIMYMLGVILMIVGFGFLVGVFKLLFNV